MFQLIFYKFITRLVVCPLLYEKIIQELKLRCEERNEQFIYNVGQTWEKFKRCIAMSKEAVLTMKTASEIKRFQDKKSLGTWFNILLPLVQSRVSCQPEQGVEPSTCTKRKSSSQLDSVDDPQSNEGEATSDDITSGSENLTASVNSENSENQNPAKSPLFSPVRRKRQRQSIGYDEAIHSLLEKVIAALEKDPTADLIKDFDRENELAWQHEIALLSIIFG